MSATACPKAGAAGARSSRDLVYSADNQPGITRKKTSDGFRYFDPAGRLIRDPAILQRIDALAIPPAYESVWICPNANGHIQATGRDARGRKQYRYHDQWTLLRSASKFGQLADFGAALPRIRRRTERDLRNVAMTQEKMSAIVLRLLELTLIRVGTRKYARANKSFGLTTLRRRHASVSGSIVRLQFRGKSGVQHDVTVSDRRMANLVKRCMEIPGHELFQYTDGDGVIRPIDSGCVNAYLKEAGGGEFTAKDYRTWAASVSALAELQCRQAENEQAARTVLNEVVKTTAKLLGNTPAVCRECYIHPAVVSAWLSGALCKAKTPRGPAGLTASERRFLAFLREAVTITPSTDAAPEGASAIS